MEFEVRELKKNFGPKQVLDGVSFSVESGSALGLLGRNGAGKTTTIRIIMGVFGGGGELLMDGKPLKRESVNFGYLPEERGLYPKKPILDQLVYFGVLRGMKAKAAKESALSWLKRLEMSEYAASKLDTLSKGNQQKIQLACALVTNPEFVILDEPFSGLDPVNAMLLKDIVLELIESGKIVLFSSHQMNYVEEFCDNVAIMNNGKIALEGNLKEIKRGYDRKKLVVTTQKPEALQAAINEKLGSRVEKTEAEDDTILVTLKSVSEKAAFTADMASLGIDFDSVSVFEPSLNDIFVEYTGTENAEKSV